MATQGERRALYFLGAVALLGAGTRAWRGRRVDVDTTALTRQIQAVDGRERAGKSSGRVGRSAKKAVRPPEDRSVKPAGNQPVDLDVARESDIEKLPGIGPALAK